MKLRAHKAQRAAVMIDRINTSKRYQSAAAACFNAGFGAQARVALTGRPSRNKLAEAMFLGMAAVAAGA